MERKVRRGIDLRYYISYVLFFIAIVILILFRPELSGINYALGLFEHILREGFPMALVAVGAGLVLSTGNVDISTTGVLISSGALFAILVNEMSSVIIAFIITSLFAISIGYILGRSVAQRKAPSLILSWAIGGILISICLIFASNSLFELEYANISSFSFPNQNYNILNSYNLISLLVFVTGVITFSNLPRNFCAIGANKTSAKLIGINVEKNVIYSFMISAFLSSIAGIYYVYLNGSAVISDFVGDELIAIAIAVLAGTVMSGGYIKIHSIIACTLFWASASLLVTNIEIGNTANQQQVLDSIFYFSFILISIVFGKILSGNTITIHTNPLTKKD